LKETQEIIDSYTTDFVERFTIRCIKCSGKFLPKERTAFQINLPVYVYNFHVGIDYCSDCIVKINHDLGVKYEDAKKRSDKIGFYTVGSHEGGKKKVDHQSITETKYSSIYHFDKHPKRSDDTEGPVPHSMKQRFKNGELVEEIIYYKGRSCEPVHVRTRDEAKKLAKIELCIRAAFERV